MTTKFLQTTPPARCRCLFELQYPPTSTGCCVCCNALNLDFTLWQVGVMRPALHQFTVCNFPVWSTAFYDWRPRLKTGFTDSRDPFGRNSHRTPDFDEADEAAAIGRTWRLNSRHALCDSFAHEPAYLFHRYQPAFPTTRGTNLSRTRVGADRVRRQRCQPTRSFEIDSDRFHVLKYRFGGHYRLLAFNFASTVAVGISQRPSTFRAPGIRPAQSFL